LFKIKDTNKFSLLAEAGVNVMNELTNNKDAVNSNIIIEYEKEGGEENDITGKIIFKVFLYIIYIYINNQIYMYFDELKEKIKCNKTVNDTIKKINMHNKCNQIISLSNLMFAGR
jgi:hypothetical protein